MGRSLTEVARSIVESNDSSPDRDINKKTANAATLRPGSKYKEASPLKNSAKLVAKAPVSLEDEGAPDFGVSKDTSRSSKAAVGPEPMHKLSEEMEELVIAMMEEGMSDEEIIEALDEAMSESPEETVEESADEDFIESVFAEGLEEGYSEDEIAEALAEYFEGQEVVEEEVEPDYSAIAQSVTDSILQNDEVGISEDVNALLEGEELSEEFKGKAETIFQAAVAARLEEGVQILEQQFAEALQEQTEAMYEQLHEEIDEILNYVVEQWMQENEVAIESGLRTELSEDFISGLRQLFMEHYVDIPENEVSLIDSMGSHIEELEEAINEEISKNIGLSNQLNEMAKHEIVSAVTEGLTTTQAEKLYTLSEGVEFRDTEEFANKILTLRESYFPQTTEGSTGLDNSDDVPAGNNMLTEDGSRISKYAQALSKR